jgi:hypothetical protein
MMGRRASNGMRQKSYGTIEAGRFQESGCG